MYRVTYSLSNQTNERQDRSSALAGLNLDFPIFGTYTSEMQSFEVAAICLTAVALILILVRRQRAAYSKHVAQLQPEKKKYSKKVKEFNIYTKEEVAKHNKADDAWIIVQDKRSKVWKVYDITDYVDEHPGGDSILQNVGRDATEGFYGPQHPETVFVMVEEYLIGKLAEGEAQ